MDIFISINISYIIKRHYYNSRKDFSEAIDASLSTVGSYINKRALPTIPKVQKICKLHGYSIDDFINKKLEDVDKQKGYVTTESETPENTPDRYKIGAEVFTMYKDIITSKESEIETRKELLKQKDNYIELQRTQIEELKENISRKDVLLNQINTLADVASKMDRDFILSYADRLREGVIKDMKNKEQEEKDNKKN